MWRSNFPRLLSVYYTVNCTARTELYGSPFMSRVPFGRCLHYTVHGSCLVEFRTQLWTVSAVTLLKADT